MKKLVSLLVALLLILPTACALAEAPMDGGWSVAESAEITEENRVVFEKALDGLVGVEYEPIAYLASQIVAGTNHCFLCKATGVYPDAVPILVLVYIYEDLEGNAEVARFANLDIVSLYEAAEF